MILRALLAWMLLLVMPADHVIRDLPGFQKAIDDGIPKLRIEEAAARTQARIDSGRQPVIGVNKYLVENDVPPEVLKVDNGKVREEHEEQLSLYALAALVKFPEVNRVYVELWYLDQGVQVPKEPLAYARADLPDLKKLWGKNTAPMLPSSPVLLVTMVSAAAAIQ